MRSETFELTEFQKSALSALKRPRCHLIGVSPTGSGKSLVYERVASLPGTRTLLVSPLIALGRQQAARLKALGVRVAFGMGEKAANPSRAGKESPEAWIVSPEKLFPPGMERLRSRFRDWQPNFLVVDECHCLWDWGGSFRPAFRRIPDLLAEFKIEKSVWLTATLPFPARQALRERLGVEVREIGTFGLPASLEFDVRHCPWPDRPAALLATAARLRSDYGKQGIVFAVTREGSERVAMVLRRVGLKVDFYHAGLAHEERLAVEARVAAGACDVVVATSAFGMGMDYQGLSWAIVWQAPLSLLTLAQAIGRVGRSGARGRAVLLWDPADFSFLGWGDPVELRQVESFLKARECRRAALTRYFEGLTDCAIGLSGCGSCDSCQGRDRHTLAM